MHTIGMAARRFGGSVAWLAVGLLVLLAAPGSARAQGIEKSDKLLGKPDATASTPKDGNPSTTTKADPPTASASAPPLVILSTRVNGQGDAAGGAVSAAGSGAPAVAAKTRCGPAAQQPAADARPADLLVSAGGDLVVVVSRESYDLAVAHVSQLRNRADTGWRLFLNGIDVSGAAQLVAAARDGQAGVALRYHLRPSPASQAFWAAVYRDQGIAHTGCLQVELGWSSSGANSQVQPGREVPQLQMAVAPDHRFVLMVVALLLLATLSAVLLVATDTFRDAVPDWLRRARVNRAGYDNEIRVQGKDSTLAQARLQALQQSFDAEACQRLAEAARAGQPVEPAAENAVIVGLLLSGESLPMPSFSLSRLQLGAWFLFAVGTGLFLWIVYGELPAISGSLVGLVGISVGTAGASIAATPDPAKVPSTVSSRNMLRDIVTGFDQSQQVHRYQAVVVNLLLLGIGMQYVGSELAFPVFDSSWLAFLGVSGIGLAAGKQIIENPGKTT